MDSWAPEPEKKTPEKTYGLGRSRDFGPRVPNGGSSGRRNLSKDTVVNFRMKSGGASPAYGGQEQADGSPTRNKLQKKNARSPGVEPLREHHNYNNVSVPNPYESGQGYSSGFYGQGQGRSPVYGGGMGAARSTDALTREIESIDIGGGRQGQGRGERGGVAFVPVRSHRDRGTYY